MTKKQNIIILLIIIILSAFFYSFNLKQTYWFGGDMARDTLQSLRILQTKKLTLIGPPLSFGQFGIREIYFGSFSYYLGVLGLLITNNNVFGPIYINIGLMIIGLYFFYKLAHQYLKNETKALIVTIIYALSPLVVAYMRSYWNPNFILTIAPIFWFFYYSCFSNRNSKISLIKSFICGLLGGLLINLHYFVIPVIFLAIYFLFIKLKDKKISIFYCLGLFSGLLPIIIFELRNNFYLIQAFIFNISHFHSTNVLSITPWYVKITYIFRILLIIFGFDYEATYIPVLIRPLLFIKILLGLFFLLYFIFISYKKKIKLRQDFIIYILISLLITIIFSKEELYIRYFFVNLPILLLIIGDILLNSKILLLIIISNMLLVSVRVTYIHKNTTFFPTVSSMQKAVAIIKSDNPSLPYNVTENFIGDARALYLRFFLEKDNQIPKSNNEEEYNNLETLYVFSPNLEITYKESRWEFTATKNLKLSKTYVIDNNKYLFKFTAE